MSIYNPTRTQIRNSALCGRGPGDFFDWAAEERERQDAEVERIASEMDRDDSEVYESMVRFSERRMDNAGVEVQHLMSVAFSAMNAWPVIEKMANGDALTRDDQARLPALYRDLKPWFAEREEAVERIAEDQVFV